MAKWSYTAGLHDVGKGCHAWLQPDGGWGLANAGLVVDGDQTLLIDTLIDICRTQDMLEGMAKAIPAARRICACVNTHSHPDHSAGNCLLHADTPIIASTAAAREMAFMSRGEDPFSKIVKDWQQHGDAGAYLHEVVGKRFVTHLSTPRLPSVTFEQEHELKVGDKLVKLIKIGPAHTAGDVVAWVPADGVLFTGDVVFHKVHPAVTPAGIEGWLAACDTLLQWPIAVVVPGHGPITGKHALQELKDYLLYFKSEAKKRYDAGLPLEAATRDIALKAFEGWADEERIFGTVAALYAGFGAPPTPFVELLNLSGRYWREKKASRL